LTVLPPKIDTSTDPQVGYRPLGALDAQSALQPFAGSFGDAARRASAASRRLRRLGRGDRALRVGLDERRRRRAAAPGRARRPAHRVPRSRRRCFDPKRSRATAQLWWLDRMLRTNRPLVEKMALFWHGHFATSLQKVQARTWSGRSICSARRRSATFSATCSLAVTRDPAMLIWLDNRCQRESAPQRELRARGHGTLCARPGQLHRRRRQGSGARLHRLDARQERRSFDPGAARRRDEDVPRADRDPSAPTTSSTSSSQQPVHQRFIARKLLEFFVYSAIPSPN
jgi:hypothetical protein